MYELRELQRSDIPLINSWRHNRDLIDMLGTTFRYIDLEIDQTWYENYLNKRDFEIRLSIISNGNMIGLVSLTNIDRFNQSAIFHIMIGESNNMSKGAGYFSTIEILKHAFFDMNLVRVELGVLENNIRAISLYERVGFKFEGIKRSSVFKNGNLQNLIIMSILKNEFLTQEWKFKNRRLILIC